MRPPVDRLMLGQARAEVKELRAEVERLQAWDRVRDAFVSELKIECAANERGYVEQCAVADALRAELEDTRKESGERQAELFATHRLLAAANELLDEYVRGPFPATKEKVRAFLANAPAAKETDHG
jgi:hypothetical protein